MAVKAIPDGFRMVTPYLMVKGADKVLDFLIRAFDAKEMRCHREPNGRIANAEVRIGDSMVMLSEAREGHAPMPSMLYLYVEDTDALYHSAIRAGGTSIMEPQDMFYGDRNGGVTDPAGNQWWIATHKEDVSDEEIARRAAAFYKK